MATQKFQQTGFVAFPSLVSGRLNVQLMKNHPKDQPNDAKHKNRHQKT